ncbi:hypothetical protein KY316_03280, partial [Candidatus Woesearchaeota archaeon]|nr:hypothetical protein [Candidatus Woesearchaeota archaeon]
ELKELGFHGRNRHYSKAGITVFFASATKGKTVLQGPDVSDACERQEQSPAWPTIDAIAELFKPAQVKDQDFNYILPQLEKAAVTKKSH